LDGSGRADFWDGRVGARRRNSICEVGLERVEHMIRAYADIDGFKFNASLTGLAVYLDNFAIIDIAKGDRSRRQRFISALHSGAQLLFSVSNAVELTGPQGDTLAAVRLMLDEIGPNWYPVELNVIEVVEREQKGASPSKSCLSENFVKDFSKARIAGFPKNKIITLADDFFSLGAVLDWVGPQRDSIRDGAALIADTLASVIARHRANYERDPKWLDRRFPALSFDPSRPATSVYVNLTRALILEFKSRRWERNDGLDFCHTVLAAAFANVAALDKHWKRRVENLPEPNQVAKIYYAPELDKMVSAIELLISRPRIVD